MYRHRADLIRLLRTLVGDGKKVLGYGASTKWNVVLQFCGFSKNDIPEIAEVNADKFGNYTAGTKFSIIAEAEARALQPDYFSVLPWHFKNGILAREQEFIAWWKVDLFPS